jgi:hypothetical protein
MPLHNFKVLRNMLARKRDEMLEPFAEQLLTVETDKNTPGGMVEWLKQRGVECRLDDITRFLRARKRRLAQQEILDKIKAATEMCRNVEKLLDKNPAPALVTLLKLHRCLILKLSTEENMNPEYIKLVDQMVRTEIVYETDQARFEQRERAMKLAENQFQVKYSENVLDKTTKEVAERIATSEATQAEKIAAMRQAAFTDVEALQQSGELVIPKA